MSEEIRFNKSAVTMVNIVIIAFAVGVAIYGTSVLLNPRLEALASSGYWALIAIAMWGVLFMRLFTMSEQITGMVFGKKIMLHHLLHSSSQIDYKKVKSIQLDRERHNISMELTLRGEVGTIDFSAIPPKQDRLKELLFRHGFSPRKHDDPAITLLRRRGNKP